MRNLKHIMLAVVLVILAASCGKKVEVSFATSEINMAPEGGEVEVALTSNGDWTVNSTPDWLTVSPTSGNGSTTLVVAAGPNTGTENRSGNVTVTTKDNSATLTVSQGFREAFVDLNPASIVCGAEGGSFSVAVTSNIAWEISAVPDWVRVEPMAGTHETSLSVTVAPIMGEISNDREANVQIGNTEASATLHILQRDEPINVISVTPSNVEISCEGGSVELSVVCTESWTATVDKDWIELGINAGEGDATLTLTVEPNDKMIPRMARARFTNQSGQVAIVTVNQEAIPDPHFLTVSPTEKTMPCTGGSFDINVECDTIWEVRSNVPWIEVSPNHGEGNGIIHVELNENTLPYDRDGRLNLISGDLQQVVMIHQEGSGAAIVIAMSPDTVFISPEGSVESIDLTANVPWTLETANWVNLLQTTGDGDATVSLYVDRNPNPVDRVATVKAKYNGQVLSQVVVFQPARIPYLEASVTEINAPAEGAMFAVSVSSNQAWFVNKGESWLSYSPDSGVGNGQFFINVQPMESMRPRSAQLHLNGQEDGSVVIITVKQGYEE